MGLWEFIFDWGVLDNWWFIGEVELVFVCFFIFFDGFLFMSICIKLIEYVGFVLRNIKS